MKLYLEHLLVTILSSLGVTDISPMVEIPENAEHGEYTTNVAMIAAKQLRKNPREVAEEIRNALRVMSSGFKEGKEHQNISNDNQNGSSTIPEIGAGMDIERVEIAGPGFINVYLSEASFISQIFQLPKREKHVQTRKKIMVEFAHPNTHKAFHIGHLRNITTGESIVRLLEAVGHEVVRANYQGDVGMHIAKAIFGLGMYIQYGDEDDIPALTPGETADMLQSVWEKIKGLEADSLVSRVNLLGMAYAHGSKLYEASPLAKTAIGQINKAIYAKGQIPGYERYYEIYKLTRRWSLDYFSAIYNRVDTTFDRYYFESETYLRGKELVEAGLDKKIFQKSEGAIIFPGESYGLHNRVFITSEGNPTYEAKDMGLGELQFKEYNPDLVIHVLGSEQIGYLQVAIKALELLFPETSGKEYHLVYGWVKLKHGKMSSRSGNVVLGEWMIDEARKEVAKILDQSNSNDANIDTKPTHSLSIEEREEVIEKAAIAAVKYAFLKVGTKSEIAFDFGESVSFTGDSGPYLQYTYARCQSVLRKVHSANSDSRNLVPVNSGNLQYPDALNPEERMVLRRLLYFPQIVEEAASRYAPNVLCTYLFQLAQEFNLFYSKHSIIESDSNKRITGNADQSVSKSSISPQKLRVAMTHAVASVLKNGLYLLGIETIEKM